MKLLNQLNLSPGCRGDYIPLLALVISDDLSAIFREYSYKFENYFCYSWINEAEIILGRLVNELNETIK